MTTCPRCQSHLPENSTYCGFCGSWLSSANVPSWPKWGGILAGLTLLFIIAWSISASGLVRVSSPSSGELSVEESLHEGALTAHKGGPPNVLTVPGGRSTEGLTVEGDLPQTSVTSAHSGMPEDILAWLRHLKRVDLKRESMNTQVASELFSLVGQVQPGAFSDEGALNADAQRRVGVADSAVTRVDGLFKELINEFQSLPPPAECRPIAEQYSRVLIETRKMIGEILESLHSADIGRLLGIMGTSYSRVDSNAKNANMLIDSLCRKYNTANEFAVFVDSKSAGVLAGANGIENYAKLLEELMKEDP